MRRHAITIGAGAVSRSLSVFCDAFGGVHRRGAREGLVAALDQLVPALFSGKAVLCGVLVEPQGRGAVGRARLQWVVVQVDRPGCLLLKDHQEQRGREASKSHFLD